MKWDKKNGIKVDKKKGFKGEEDEVVKCMVLNVSGQTISLQFCQDDSSSKYPSYFPVRQEKMKESQWVENWLDWRNRIETYKVYFLQQYRAQQSIYHDKIENFLNIPWFWSELIESL